GRPAAEPFEDFGARVASVARRGGHDLVFANQVFFNSAAAAGSLDDIARAVEDEQTLVVFDGYHGFMALPTVFAGSADRAFYIAGGYKYAMAGRASASCIAREALPCGRATPVGSPRSVRFAAAAAQRSRTARTEADSWAPPSTRAGSTAWAECSIGWRRLA